MDFSTRTRRQSDPAAPSQGATYYFYQECAVCGRPSEVALELLGTLVYCQHCGGRFTARSRRETPAERNDSPLERANRLLALLETRDHRTVSRLRGSESFHTYD